MGDEVIRGGVVVKAIVMDLRRYESLTTILEDINARLKKLGPVDCISCYLSQHDGRFNGFFFTYNESTVRRENLVFQIEGIRIPNPDDAESIVNEELWRIEEGGMRLRYIRLYWRQEFVLALMTIGRRA